MSKNKAKKAALNKLYFQEAVERRLGALRDAEAYERLAYENLNEFLEHKSSTTLCTRMSSTMTEIDQTKT